jgi:hypothetical protein
MAFLSAGKLEDYSYVTEPDGDLKCVVCLGVAKDPLQHEECGKLICKQCMERHGKSKPCPHCRTQGSKFYQDQISKFTMLARAPVAAVGADLGGLDQLT